MNLLAEWVRDPGLVPVWAAARDRMERNGVQPSGVVTVTGLDRASRHAVSGLLGRPVVRDSVRVDLHVLDDVVRERSGVGGLVAVLEALGGPLRNRPAERSSVTAAREAPYSALRSWLHHRPDVATQPWVEPWLAGVRRSGLLSRDPDGVSTLLRAVRIASDRGAGAEPVARTQLAADSTGDSHALDEGTVLAQLVLRALAAAAGEPMPTTASGRRALWDRYGVLADAVSSTCLTLGLRPGEDTPVARRLRLAADAGDPVHVTGWDVVRSDLSIGPDTWVLVCENPRVLEAVAEQRGGDVVVVCTAGMPGLVALEVLRRLRDGGAYLAYHGDFDWPGIAIANRMVAQVGCHPWRMSAADYLTAARDDGPPLEGSPVSPSWDVTLGTAMKRRGVAVHEEAVVAGLIDALR